MPEIQKVIYAGKLIGQIEAKRAEADKLTAHIYKMAHRLRTLQRDAQWNVDQLNLHAINILTTTEMSSVGSLMRALDQETALADKILGKKEGK